MEVDNSGGYIAEVQIVFPRPIVPTKCAASKANESVCTKKVDAASCPAPSSSGTCKMDEILSCSEPAEKTCESVPDTSPHKITRNPFFNFLRDFRNCHKGVSAKVTAADGAQQWNTMSEKDKSKYIVQAFHTPKRNYRSKTKMSKEVV